MPKHIEKRLKKQARERGLKSGTERYNAYVYGTLDRIEKAAGKGHKRNRDKRG